MRRGGKKRQLKQTGPIFQIENEYSAQPLRYVREAQIGLEQEKYDEAWAVFDKNGHSHHEQAFELAKTEIENKCVNIAFSSISFEYWILLHFEENRTAFNKSMCRRNHKNKKEFYYCGTNEHTNDCHGTKCVCGAIISKGFLAYENNTKNFKFEDFNQHLTQAIERAVKLKNSYLNSTTPIYELNPYSDIYRLVFKLHQLPNVDYQWFDMGQTQNINKIAFKISQSADILSVTITNKSKAAFLVTQNSICLLNCTGGKFKSEFNLFIEPDNYSIITLNLNGVTDFTPIFISLRKTEKEYFICELENYSVALF